MAGGVGLLMADAAPARSALDVGALATFCAGVFALSEVERWPGWDVRCLAGPVRLNNSMRAVSGRGSARNLMTFRLNERQS